MRVARFTSGQLVDAVPELRIHPCVRDHAYLHAVLQLRDAIDAGTEVLRLAELAAAARAHGVVCSGREAASVRTQFGDRLAVLVPGVRASSGATDDQARVVTPKEAAASGATYVVIGRMVTAAPDRRAALDSVLADIA